jgi:hypothetical protein
MRLEASQRRGLALIPKPCVVGSNPTGGALRMSRSRSMANTCLLGDADLGHLLGGFEGCLVSRLMGRKRYTTTAATAASTAPVVTAKWMPSTNACLAADVTALASDVASDLADAEGGAEFAGGVVHRRTGARTASDSPSALVPMTIASSRPAAGS